MKRLSVLLLFVAIFSCEKKVEIKDHYIVEGHAPGVYNGIRAYLKAPDERGRLMDMDTAIVIDERFSFKGKQDEPTFQFLFINGVDGFLPVIVENGLINIQINKDHIQTSEITGTPNNLAYKDYYAEEREISDKLKELNNTIRTIQRDSIDKRQRVFNEINSLKETLNNLALNYTRENSDSFLSILLLDDVIKSNKLPLEDIEKSFTGLSETLKSSSYGKNVSAFIETQKQILEAQKATEIGGTAPNFSAPNPNGELLSLNDAKGKVTIIDFWASWCGPCRRENPNVVRVYNKYHDKGLEIIGVSLDRGNQKERWLKAIEDDNLTWHHVSNLQFWQDPIAKMYNVRSIPATFILDAQGKIIAKNLRGQALENKMAELLQ